MRQWFPNKGPLIYIDRYIYIFFNGPYTKKRVTQIEKNYASIISSAEGSVTAWGTRHVSIEVNAPI